MLKNLPEEGFPEARDEHGIHWYAVFIILNLNIRSDTTTNTRCSRSFPLIARFIQRRIHPHSRLEVVDPVTVDLANLIRAFPFLIRSLSGSLYRVGQSLGRNSHMVAFSVGKSCNDSISRCSPRLFDVGS